MIKKINWKLYGILLGMAIVSLILGLPYVASLQGDAITFNLFIRFLGLNGAISAVVIFFGLFFSKNIGLDIPILRAYTAKKKIPKDKLNYLYKWAPILGLIFGILIYSLDLLFAPYLKDLSEAATQAGYQFVWWKSLLAAFYGGIFEEILMRLFSLSFYAWIITWVLSKFRKEEIKENKTVIWFAIIFSAISFGVGHLPTLMAMTELTTILVIRTVLLNALPGIFFGWLFYKKGLEHAMVSHFFADISLHLIMPLFFT